MCLRGPIVAPRPRISRATNNIDVMKMSAAGQDSDTVHIKGVNLFTFRENGKRRTKRDENPV